MKQDLHFRAVWRWHFYAGLFAAPVLVMLAITGSLYLFSQEIDALWHRDLLTVQVAGNPLPLAAQENALRARWPEAAIASATLPRARDQASRWALRFPDGEVRDVFVDPYSAQIRGSANAALDPMTIVRKLHGELLSGTAGSYLVELVACWTLVMLATGMYLWWPQRWQASAFIPRNAAIGRPFLRDWHSIPAMFNALLVMFLVCTGLPWSVFWGAQLAKLGQHAALVAPSPNFTAHLPESITGLPWTIQHHGAPQGSIVPRVTIEQAEPALQMIDVAMHGPGLKVSYPQDSGGVFVASYVPDRAQGQRTLYLDPGDGSVLGNIGWADYSPAAMAIEWGVMTHMGQQYGLANQFANLAVCLLLIGSVVAGIVLWWKRRPPGRLAAPVLKDGDRLPRFLVITLITMGALFPLLGVSLLLVLLLDRYAARDSGLGRAIAKP